MSDRKHSTFRVLKKLFKISLLTIAAWLLIGPMALLQLGAWSWMITSYSQESGFEQAIKDTFGDERPCDLCLIIDAAEDNPNASQQPANVQIKDLKLMLGLAQSIRLQIPARTVSSNKETKQVLIEVVGNVPTPPPRA